jgi:hypothetical protein
LSNIIVPAAIAKPVTIPRSNAFHPVNAETWIFCTMGGLIAVVGLEVAVDGAVAAVVGCASPKEYSDSIAKR